MLITGYQEVDKDAMLLMNIPLAKQQEIIMRSLVLRLSDELIKHLPVEVTPIAPDYKTKERHSVRCHVLTVEQFSELMLFLNRFKSLNVPYELKSEVLGLINTLSK